MGWVRLCELRNVDNERLADWVRSSDVVVLPYSAVQNSGSAILALSAGRPVVVPRVGGMQELQDEVGSDWVHMYEGEFTAAVLAECLRWSAERDPDARIDLSGLDWLPIAEATVEAYRSTLARSRRSRRSR